MQTQKLSNTKQQFKCFDTDNTDTYEVHKTNNYEEKNQHFYYFVIYLRAQVI
jgi:hypothetical protein